MKIILSRKGFDSAVGGVPSPIFTCGGLRSLPIPSPRGVQLKAVRYRQYDLGAVVSDLSRGRYTGDSVVHLDPDLSYESLQRQPGWRPLFGQTGAAQGHLLNEGITRGDVFVFYGWFRQVVRVDGRFSYPRHAPHVHLIFGWLQIDAAFSVSDTRDVPPWALYHPHFVRPSRYKNDTVYMAADRLTLPGFQAQLPGAGTFDRFDPRLCLTRAGASRSVWRVPSWLYPAGRKPLTYHNDLRRWQVHGDELLLRAAQQGQEFVLDCDAYPEAIPWLVDLLGSPA